MTTKIAFTAGKHNYITVAPPERDARGVKRIQCLRDDGRYVKFAFNAVVRHAGRIPGEPKD